MNEQMTIPIGFTSFTSIPYGHFLRSSELCRPGIANHSETAEESADEYTAEIDILIFYVTSECDESMRHEMLQCQKLSALQQEHGADVTLTRQTGWMLLALMGCGTFKYPHF